MEQARRAERAAGEEIPAAFRCMPEIPAPVYGTFILLFPGKDEVEPVLGLRAQGAYAKILTGDSNHGTISPSTAMTGKK